MVNEELKHVSSSSLDITKQNIEKLKELFPEVLSEKKIDFDKLRLILGDEVETEPERYGFTWNGKKQSMQLAQKPTDATLKPNKEKSQNWDKTQNLYIEGDNLEVLKILQKSYASKVKLIYIDPPYNTGNDFVYKDDFKNSIENYLDQTNQVDSQGNKFRVNSETSGRYHTDWLNMMYPRLKLARNLLTEDGAIFISIDENEYRNLRAICDEIFGENNYRNTLLVRRRVKSLNIQFAEQGLKTFNVGAEYIIVYSKTKAFSFKAIEMKKEKNSEKGSWNVFWSNADRPSMRYDILGFTPTTGQWRWSKEKAKDAIENYRKYVKEYSSMMSIEEYAKQNPNLKFIRRIQNGKGKNGGVQYYVAPSETSLRTSDWTDLEVSQIAKDYNDLIFDNPKNVDLIKEIIKAVGKTDIVVDFFSGSGTTGDAVFRFNQEFNATNRFILVQLPEKLSANNIMKKSGYNYITDIAEERLRRSGEKLRNESSLLADKIDTGFKVFELSKSNIKRWNNNPSDIVSQIELLKNNFEEDSKPIDIVYEIMLKQGLDLSYPIKETIYENSVIYDIAFGAMFVVLGNEISSGVADYIIKQIAKEKAENSVIVLQDEKFVNDSEKLNTIEKLNVNGIQHDDIFSI